jgi:hypothetical protein
MSIVYDSSTPSCRSVFVDETQTSKAVIDPFKPAGPYQKTKGMYLTKIAVEVEPTG